jgi:hypothetical protein
MLLRKSICVANKSSLPDLNENERRGVRSKAQTSLPKSWIVETSIKKGDLSCNAVRSLTTVLKSYE